MRSFAFLGDSFILVSTRKPPALLVYGLQQIPADGTTHPDTYLLRFLFGNPDIGDIILDSNSSPGWLPSARRQVPFQIAGDVRIITMNLRSYHNYGHCEKSLISTKALLRYIANLPSKEGHDVDWGLHCSLISERILGHGRWDQWICSTFGMRYILPAVVHICGKPKVIICDLCPGRCLRASKEERQESELLYQTLMGVPHRNDQSYPRSILKSVSLPENIRNRRHVILMISDGGIVVIEQVRQTNGVCTFS
jgi:hypothetical protein